MKKKYRPSNGQGRMIKNIFKFVTVLFLYFVFFLFIDYFLFPIPKNSIGRTVARIFVSLFSGTISFMIVYCLQMAREAYKETKIEYNSRGEKRQGRIKKMYTRKQLLKAKGETMKIWWLLWQNPAKTKGDFDLLFDIYDDCPLCTLFCSEGRSNDYFEEDSCMGCPLNTKKDNCFISSSWYQIWANPRSTVGEKKEAAYNIFKKASDWKV